MLVRSTPHSTWQVLRAAQRSAKPMTGRALWLTPTRATKDGGFLADLVEEGLLAFVTGTAAAPFDATYALTERGQHAAEYGEYDPKRPAMGAEAKPVAGPKTGPVERLKREREPK